jgi:hypothetical protein
MTKRFAGIAGVVFILAGILLAVRPWDAPEGGKDRTAREALAGIPVGWTKLPRPPQPRDAAAFVWTGSELLAWGGCPAAEGSKSCVRQADGFAFDPSGRRWRAIPEAPHAWKGATADWTGEEVIFLNRRGDGFAGLLEGQAYDPAQESWRQIPRAPIGATRGSVVTVWTGSELIVWGGGERGSRRAQKGASYDPEADAWRAIADAPIGLNLASGMWTGREVLVFGSLLSPRNRAQIRASVGAAYTPAADSWREIPPSKLSPQATSAVWIRDRMVAWDYLVRSQEYDPARDAWSERIRMPLEPSECYPESVVAQALVFAFYCGEAALYGAGAHTWHEVRGGPLEREVESGDVSLALWRSASLAPAGDVVLALEGSALSVGDLACYGCPGFPVSYWAYRPPPK